MEKYFIGYLIYAGCVLISYTFGKRTGVFKKFPVLALICIPTDNFILMASLGFCVIAAYMDIEDNMNVYDIYHIIPIIVIFSGIVYKVINKNFYIRDIFNFYNLVPVIFVIFTVTTRGFADTLALLVYSLLGIYLKLDALYIIMGFTLSYFIQFIKQCIICKKKGISLKNKEPSAFLPSLYIGNSIIIISSYLSAPGR